MENKKNIMVVGANGKMGSLICKNLESRYNIFKVTEENNIMDFEKKNIDVAIDFSNASQSVVTAKFCEERKIPLIIGATGHSEEQKKLIELSKQKTKIIMKSNFSLGVKILTDVIQIIGKNMEDRFVDITILEKHHGQKLDSPSGTALFLKQIINKSFCSENLKINILSERGGQEIGTHTIDIYFGDELISISHKAFSRSAFVDGVIDEINKMNL